MPGKPGLTWLRAGQWHAKLIWHLGPPPASLPFGTPLRQGICTEALYGASIALQTEKKEARNSSHLKPVFPLGHMKLLCIESHQLWLTVTLLDLRQRYFLSPAT